MCRPRPSPSMACRPSSSRTSRCLPRSPTTSSPSSATRRWSSTMPASTSAFSSPSSSASSAPLIARERLIDTLMLARRKHPAGPNRLDDLCARYGIDNSRRTKHGALLDAEILAEVYLELIGARQAQLGLAENGARRGRAATASRCVAQRGRLRLRRASATPSAPRTANSWRAGREALWRDYLRDRTPESRSGYGAALAAPSAACSCSCFWR